MPEFIHQIISAFPYTKQTPLGMGEPDLGQPKSRQLFVLVCSCGSTFEVSAGDSTDKAKQHVWDANHLREGD